MVEVVPEWWVFLIAIVFIVLLIFWDDQSRPKKLRHWRILAIVLIGLSLLGLYMKPYVRVEGEDVKVALLTDPVEITVSDSLKKTGFVVVNNLEEYLKLTTAQNITEMIVAGNGLEAWELDQMAHGFTFLPSPHMIEGPLEMLGNVASAHSLSPLIFRIWLKEPADIHLSGAGIQPIVKSMLPEDEVVVFEVNPQVAGNLTYKLIGVREGDTLFSELVPIKVKERVGFNTLLLTNAPSFELRFLKNLLKEEGYGVAERIQVTKGTYRESFSNMESRPLSRISRKLLEDFKVLIMDKASYDQLSYTEKQYVNDALKKGALGVIWMDDESSDWIKTKKTKAFVLSLKSGQQTVELNTSGATSEGYDAQISFQGSMIGNHHSKGLGKIMLPLLASTYQLKLKGHDELYSELWNALMHPIVGYNLLAPDIRFQDFPRVNEPSSFAFRSESVVNVYLDSVRLGVREQWHQPHVFKAECWPEVKGWNTVQVGDVRHSFFVFDEGDWMVQKIFQKQMLTANYAKRSVNKMPQSHIAEKPVSKWIFFLVIVISLCFLWVEQRVG